MANEEFNPEEEVKKVRATLDSPDKFAQILKQTLEKSKDADKAIKKIIIELLKEDKGCKKEIESIVNEFDRKEYNKFWKNTGSKIFFGIWTFLIIFATAVVNKFIK